MYRVMRNRVWRPFVGGMLLDEFQGISPAADGNYPEEWVCSTVEARDGTGLSRLEDGKSLRDVIGKNLDVLVKVLDSCTRLMIQVHPDRERAMRYFRSPYGKTEAWYILDTRVINGEEPYVLLGFKEGITCEKWMELYRRQDVAGMIDAMHKIPVKKGDTFFIPGGVPHAMGTGVFFAEIQEPTDITFRVERISPDGKELPDEDLHQGAGFDALFSCFDYNGRSLEDTLKDHYLQPRVDGRIIDEQQTPYFSMQLINVEETATVSVTDYAIVLVLSGADSGSEYYLDEDTVFNGKQQLLVCKGKIK